MPCDAGDARIFSKEFDEETGLYYYGVRYLDPKYSRWLSGDPALNDYIPKAPIDDEAKKHNESLPGMGGVFNVVNLHVYHYAGNNPIRYIDPDGRTNYIVVSMFSGGDSENVGTTFIDAADTRKKEIESSPSFDPSTDTVTRYDIDSGEKHVDLCYLYLYKKGIKINQLLESKFLDETTTNIIFNGIQLKKGDVAWTLYSDINFSDIFYNELLNEYDYTSGMEFFLDTINNPMLRIEILKKIRKKLEQ